MGILTPDEWADLDARLGPEPLDPSFTPANLAGRLEGSRAPLRNALLDQSRIAGLGNVYANEACHRARLDPRRPAGGLASAEVRRLHAAIRALLEAAIERRGTTFSNYQDIGGESGAFQDDLAVYGRSGEPCPRCGGAIARVVLAGRSAFHCTGCQS
jgi:formamidopyrimidine-DNA glycosylase